MQKAHAEAHTKLKQIEADLSDARGEYAVLRRDAEKAKQAFVKAPDNDPKSGVFRRAQKASEEADAARQKIDDLKEVQGGMLKMFAQGGQLGRDQDGPRSGDFGGTPWRALAQGIDLPGGVNRVDRPLSDLVAPPAMAGVTVSPSSGLTAPTLFRPEITEMARDERHLFMAFPTELAEDQTLGVSDYRQTGERTVTGTVERDPISTAAKAQLNVQVTAETLPLRQVAVVLEKVPSKLVESLDTFTSFLQNEMAFQLRLALDAHVAAAITASGPAKGEAGSDLIAKIRKAVEAARAAGAKVSVLAVSPAVASELDLTKTELGYIFAIRDVGGSSPLFGLTVIEVPGLAKPTLIDPQTAGVLYLGMARLFIDPYSGLAKNEVRLRLEAETLMWVRDPHGLYVIDKAE